MKKELTQKQAYLKVLENIYESLDKLRKDTLFDYRVVGKEDDQAKDWSTGELLWEDEEKTIPKYRDHYDYVEIPQEELSYEARATLDAIRDIKRVLTPLI